jgi:ketosteroid isomerase-like protein
MTPKIGTATGHSQIRNFMDKWGEAVRHKDSIELTSNVAPDVILFDVVNPLRYSGATSLKKRAEEWFSSFRGPIGFEVRDLSITASDDVAFCHSLNRVVGTSTQGTDIDMWWRATLGFRKVNGQWLVTHEHSSVPFDTGSGTASLDLRP